MSSAHVDDVATERTVNVASEVLVPVPHVIEWATLFDSVGFLWGLWFPPTSHYKSPNIVFRVNNDQVDARLSIQRPELIEKRTVPN
jgi:hypothetical protein